MSDGDLQLEAIGELGLEFGLPGARAGAITTARVGQDEQVPGARILNEPFVVPPVSDGMSGKGRGVVRDANGNRAAIGASVVDAVGDGDTEGIGAEVVV